MLNKKSQVEDWLSFIFAVLIIVFVVFFFPSKSIARTKIIKEKIDFATLTQYSDELLTSYFRHPFTYKNLQGTNIVDAINNYFVTNDDDLLKQIKDVTNEFFSRSDLATDYLSWSLEIYYPEKPLIILESEESRTQYIIRKEISKIIIPTYYNNKFMEIKLFFVQTRYVAG